MRLDFVKYVDFKLELSYKGNLLENLRINYCKGELWRGKEQIQGPIDVVVTSKVLVEELICEVEFGRAILKRTGDYQWELTFEGLKLENCFEGECNLDLSFRYKVK